MNRRTGNRITVGHCTDDKEQENRKLSENFELGNRRTENIRADNICISIGKWSKNLGKLSLEEITSHLSKPG